MCSVRARHLAVIEVLASAAQYNRLAPAPRPEDGACSQVAVWMGEPGAFWARELHRAVFVQQEAVGFWCPACPRSIRAGRAGGDLYRRERKGRGPQPGGWRPVAHELVRGHDPRTICGTWVRHACRSSSGVVLLPTYVGVTQHPGPTRLLLRPLAALAPPCPALSPAGGWRGVPARSRGSVLVALGSIGASDVRTGVV
jgi:hypothetical protein